MAPSAMQSILAASVQERRVSGGPKHACSLSLLRFVSSLPVFHWLKLAQMRIMCACCARLIISNGTWRLARLRLVKCFDFSLLCSFCTFPPQVLIDEDTAWFFAGRPNFASHVSMIPLHTPLALVYSA